MVSIIKQKIGKQTYYYLTHHNSHRTKREYLGKTIPHDVEERKSAFLLKFYREDWMPYLEAIQKNYQKNRKKMPKSAVAEELADFVIWFTHHTQKIEGSRLTRLDTERLLRYGTTPANKPKSDMIEAELARDVFMEMLRHEKALSLNTIRYWHTRMFNRTKIDIAGEIRDYDLYVRGSKTKFPSGETVYDLLQEFFRWYNRAKPSTNPIELAGLAHFRFESIHPFGDGNGRIGRLLMNSILHENGCPMLNILYAQRTQYYNALERSNSENTEIPFLRWFVGTYVDSHRQWA